MPGLGDSGQRSCAGDHGAMRLRYRPHLERSRRRARHGNQPRNRLHERDRHRFRWFYRLLLLPVGQYTISVEAPKFATLVREAIQVNLGQTVRLNAQLELPTIAETVTVSGGAQLVDTTTNTLGGDVTGRELVDLPLNGRNFTQLAAADRRGAVDIGRGHCGWQPSAGSGICRERHAPRIKLTWSMAGRTSIGWMEAMR